MTNRNRASAIRSSFIPDHPRREALPGRRRGLDDLILNLVNLVQAFLNHHGQLPAARLVSLLARFPENELSFLFRLRLGFRLGHHHFDDLLLALLSFRLRLREVRSLAFLEDHRLPVELFRLRRRHDRGFPMKIDHATLNLPIRSPAQMEAQVGPGSVGVTHGAALGRGEIHVPIPGQNQLQAAVPKLVAQLHGKLEGQVLLDESLLPQIPLPDSS
jgi:hypothetical protein